MSDSSITLHKDGGSTHAGMDAVRRVRAIATRSAIAGHRKFGMIPTRGVTITKLLAIATEFTGKPYKGAGKHERAEADLTVWIDTMTCALPVIDERAA
jgi:hypothetical protein